MKINETQKVSNVETRNSSKFHNISIAEASSEQEHRPEQWRTTNRLTTLDALSFEISQKGKQKSAS